MIRKLVLGLALIGVAFAGLDCNWFFGLDDTQSERPNASFAGCFRGPIADPPGPGVLTIVLEPPVGAVYNLQGCMAATEPAFQAPLEGAVDNDIKTQANLAVMPPGRPVFAVQVDLQVAADPNATSVTVVNQTQMPFKRAPNLARCATPPTTCAGLGITQPFMP